MRIGKAGECFFVLGDTETSQVTESLPLNASPILTPEEAGSSPVLVSSPSPKLDGEPGDGELGGGGGKKGEKKSTWSWLWGSFPRSRKNKEKAQMEDDNLSESSALTDKEKSIAGTSNSALLGPPAIPSIAEGHVLGSDDHKSSTNLDSLESLEALNDEKQRPRTRSLVRAMSSNLLRDSIASSTLLEVSSSLEHHDILSEQLSSNGGGETGTDGDGETAQLPHEQQHQQQQQQHQQQQTTSPARTVEATEPAWRPLAGSALSPELSSTSPPHPPTTNSGLLPSVHDTDHFSIELAQNNTQSTYANPHHNVIESSSPPSSAPLSPLSLQAADMPSTSHVDMSAIPAASEQPHAAANTAATATISNASSRASSPPHLSSSEMGAPGSPETASAKEPLAVGTPGGASATAAGQAGPASATATASAQSVMAPGSNKSLFPTPEQLKRLNLVPGRNKIEFEVTSTLLGRQTVEASIWLLSRETKIVISDIDGTITKSDFFGQVLPAVGKDWSQPGVASLFTRIAANGYQLLYLTSRAIGQAGQTRGYIESVNQTGLRLPPGPVIMSPDRLLQSFHREVIKRTPEEFKIRALSSILRLFPPEAHAFYAGFGNRVTDFISYRAVSIAESRIFVINPKGDILQEHRNLTYKSSYNTLSDIAEHVFPPLNKDKHQSSQSSQQFNSFLYWSNPIPVVPIEEED